MSSDGKFFLGVIVAVILVIGGIVFYSSRHSNSKLSNVDVTDGQKLGPDNAKVQVIEFADFQCPACAAAAPEVRKIQQDNPDVQLIFKNFPLITIHKNTAAAAAAGDAAAKQGKFWEMYDKLYATQSEWEGNADPTAHFVSYATNIGMNADQFTADMNSDAIKKSVQDDYNYALSLSLNETPTFIVNGTKYTGGMTEAQWNAALAAARK